MTDGIHVFRHLTQYVSPRLLAGYLATILNFKMAAMDIGNLRYFRVYFGKRTHIGTHTIYVNVDSYESWYQWLVTWYMVATVNFYIHVFLK